MPLIRRMTVLSRLVPLAFLAAASSPAVACTQPVGIGPDEPYSATQSAPVALDEGASITYGHNSAWYEWNQSTQTFVRVWSWYDPYSDSTPIQPDEIDVTDDPEFGELAGVGVQTGSGPLSGESIACEGGPRTEPPTDVTATVFRANNSVVSFSFRSQVLGQIGQSRRMVRIQGRQESVDVNDRDCDPQMEDLVANGIIRAHWTSRPGGSANLPQNYTFTLVFRDGRRSDWTTAGADVRPTGTACY